MMTGSSPHGVVVGIDGSDHAEEALDWAADEAALRRAPLRIAHAWSLATYPMPAQDRGDIAQSIAEAADELLHRAEDRVRARHAELEVGLTTITQEEAVPGLIRLAQRAELLVVGSRGLSRFTSVLIGSVSQSLVAHAPCPVVVLRGSTRPTGPRAGTDSADTPLATDAPVLLGVGPDESQAPIEFAFAEADRRGVPLLAVRSWQYPPNFGGYIALPPDDTAQRDHEEAEELGALVAAARKEFPDVRMLQRVGLNETAWDLADASAGACLAVIGAERGRHRFALPVGRVAQQVLHHAHCPVAVVPHH